MPVVQQLLLRSRAKGQSQSHAHDPQKDCELLNNRSVIIKTFIPANGAINTKTHSSLQNALLYIEGLHVPLNKGQLLKKQAVHKQIT